MQTYEAAARDSNSNDNTILHQLGRAQQNVCTHDKTMTLSCRCDVISQNLSIIVWYRFAMLMSVSGVAVPCHRHHFVFLDEIRSSRLCVWEVIYASRSFNRRSGISPSLFWRDWTLGSWAVVAVFPPYPTVGFNACRKGFTRGCT